MARPEDTRFITQGEYRERRAYLADHVFLGVPGGGQPPNDLLGQKEWEHLMDGATDVLLRTTDYLGSMIDDMGSLAFAWVTSIPPDPMLAPFVFDAYLEAHDEFEAAPFIAAHGWYRQATAGLRNALEVMTHAVRYAVRNDSVGFQQWQSGDADPPKIGNSIELIAQSSLVAAVEQTLGGPTLFGRNPDGVMPSLYADVCRYAHGRPGHTNADMWKGSNGPVFVGGAFTQFWLDFCDVFLACLVLLKIGYPALALPDGIDDVAGNAGTAWQRLAPAAIAAYFP
jgi:hypothetical protein